MSCSRGWYWPLSWSSGAWDASVSWYLQQAEASTVYPLDLDFVRDHHLRGANGTAEDDYIFHLIKVATRMAETYMRRPVMPQSLSLVLDGFPAGSIEVPMPVSEVISITYQDANGDPQTLSAADYQVSHAQALGTRKGIISLAPSASWPTTESDQVAAVTVTFRSGFATIGSPEVAEVPADIKHGLLLVIGEMYKQRSESVIGPGVEPAVLRAQRDFWHPYRVY